MDREEWMYQKNRVSAEFQMGVKEFIRIAEQDMVMRGVKFIYCPCIDCTNLRRFNNSAQIEDHLIRRGFVRNYIHWIHHGETISNPPVCNEDMLESDHELERDMFEDDNLDERDMFEDDNLDQMLRDVEGNYTEREFEKFKSLMEDDAKPLFSGCKAEYTKLGSVLALFELKAKHRWTDTSFNALLDLLSDMLPEGNELPTKIYEAKKLLCPMGMEIERIHACPNDCILYRNAHKELLVCPICGVPRYKQKEKRNDKKRKSRTDDGTDMNKGAPAKVLWYLPIIPRLERLFANPKEAKLLRWHYESRKEDGKLRHPADSAQWRNIDWEHEEFGVEMRNIRFGLSTDGMNPFGNMSSRHSTWPVLLCIYNLPPWLCMKRKYIMMSLLISGPKQPGNDIDVYLAPLIEDLLKLWNEGVVVWDAYKRENFTLRAMIFCTINDFPALGNLAGYSTKGAKACPICEEETESLWLPNSKKTVYMGHRRFLPRSHRFRKMDDKFDGKREVRAAPQPMSGRQVYSRVEDIDVQYGKSRKSVRPRTIWKKRSIFWDLPYWKELDVRHCIDVMHVEKNVCDNLVGILLNIPGKTKDGVNARRDMAYMGIRPKLAVVEEVGKGPYIPAACYTLSKKEKEDLCRCLQGIKVPSGYSANIKKLVSMDDLKLLGMKSHDCHVLMTQMLPIAIRNILPEDVRLAITKLCYFFNAISSKVIDPDVLDNLQSEVVLTLCQLEMLFPPSFFDVMVHLVVHLVREIKICGPAFLRHMYPFERYMGILKSYVRNRSKPEGSIVEGYGTEEVIEFCVDYLGKRQAIGVPVSRHEGRLGGKGTIGSNLTSPQFDMYRKAHFTVLQHSAEVHPYIQQHQMLLREENPYMDELSITRKHNDRFLTWFKEKAKVSVSENVKWLADGPRFNVQTWQGYDINGYTFYTESQDAKSTVQNSGVSIDALSDDHSKRGSSTAMNSYYGMIEEIWELDYGIYQVPLFRCKWVRLPHGVKVDKRGFTLVDLNRLAYKDEPFVLAKQATQVFYVRDPANPRLHVVLHGKRRIVGVENVADEEEYSQFDEIPPFAEGTYLSGDDDTHGTNYMRVDHQEGLYCK